MNDPTILDAPEEEKKPGKISFLLPFITTIGLVFPFLFIFSKSTHYLQDLFNDVSFWVSDEEFELMVVSFLGLYVFHSKAKDTLSKTIKLAAISGFIIFFALIIAVAVLLFMMRGDSFLPFWDSLYYSLYNVIPASILAGCGFSFAIQFYFKKKYFLFLLIVIPTIFLFTLID